MLKDGPPRHLWRHWIRWCTDECWNVPNIKPVWYVGIVSRASCIAQNSRVLITSQRVIMRRCQVCILASFSENRIVRLELLLAKKTKTKQKKMNVQILNADYFSRVCLQKVATYSALRATRRAAKQSKCKHYNLKLYWKGAWVVCDSAGGDWHVFPSLLRTFSNKKTFGSDSSQLCWYWYQLSYRLAWGLLTSRPFDFSASPDLYGSQTVDTVDKFLLPAGFGETRCCSFESVLLIYYFVI